MEVDILQCKCQRRRRDAVKAARRRGVDDVRADLGELLQPARRLGASAQRPGGHRQRGDPLEGTEDEEHERRKVDAVQCARVDGGDADEEGGRPP